MMFERKIYHARAVADLLTEVAPETSTNPQGVVLLERTTIANVGQVIRDLIDDAMSEYNEEMKDEPAGPKLVGGAS